MILKILKTESLISRRKELIDKILSLLNEYKDVSIFLAYQMDIQVNEIIKAEGDYSYIIIKNKIVLNNIMCKPTKNDKVCSTCGDTVLKNSPQMFCSCGEEWNFGSKKSSYSEYVPPPPLITSPTDSQGV